ncbi:MAG TPA: imidazolonepropionase [Acidimicrobiales bacterium]|nr:imidazolonepropionase [Acidimicrobiales bacterium]
MTSLAVTGIGTLVTCDEEAGRGPLGVVPRGALVCDRGQVVYAGPEASAPSGTDERVDVGGRCVMPGFVDSHTHLIFAGDRAAEFAARMAGADYHPGGILDTVAATRAAPAEELEDSARRLVALALANGTTTVEIKTGYGLDALHEATHIGIARRLTEEATLLGAHLVPAEFAADRAGYLEMVCHAMIPAASGVARWCDVFCERGAFDVDESRAVLDAARSHGLGLRVHANQLGPSGGVELACQAGAASADHCTHLTPADIDSLASSDTVATLLPISDFCTRQPYPAGRALLDAGAVVALATNCNPGSSYSISMPLALALAVRHCGLTIDEAIVAATSGGAAALQRNDIGALRPGARADALVLDAPHPAHLVYRLGTQLVAAVLRAGVWDAPFRPRPR